MPGNDAEDIKTLKNLLLHEEIDRIDKIEARLDDPLAEAERVSGVIAEAVIIRTSKDNMFSKALEPIVENSLMQNMNKRPQDYINILFPIIGSTIRKSISEMFNSMLGSFSKGVENSFSIKGIKWRIEAARSGKSFSEVVMLHTLVYSIDQVFLIHCETGLLLAHVVREGAESKDADMVSGMLTAIQSFAKDCFNKDDDASSLNSLKMDQYTIFLEQSPSIYIACVARGEPPSNFPAKLRECVELILAEFRDHIAQFTGDISHFTGAEKYLADLVDAKFVDDGKKLSRKVRAVPIIILSILLLLLLFKGYSSWKMNKGLNLIKSEPGVLLLDVKKFWSYEPWEILILHDDLAPKAEDILTKHGYKEDLLNIQSISFVSHDPEIVERRIMSKLEIPITAAAVFDRGTLRLIGNADINWIMDARQLAMNTPGVLRVDTSDISDPRFNELQRRVKEIEGAYIFFPLGKAYPVGREAQKLELTMDRLATLERLAQDMSINVSLTIYGHADQIGSLKQNYEISQERAKTIAYMLYARGSHIPVSVFGMGSEYAASDTGESPESRKIELKVNLLQNIDGFNYK